MMSEITKLKDINKVSFGFWAYLMTDAVLFASLFAVYAVLHKSTAGGPGSAELFDINFVLAETIILLVSSFTAGLALLAIRSKNLHATYVALGVTFILGVLFLGLELYEFNAMVNEGHGWWTSGFLSAFFTLVGTHGLHIAVGLIWLVVLGIYIWKRGMSDISEKRLVLFSLYWHFLDIIWIFIFTLVYMIGALG